MNVLSVKHIDGPNVYIYKPVIVARVDLEELSERESYEFPGFSDGLLRAFPGLREHHCAKGEPGGFVERLYGGTYFGHIVEHLCIELACCLGLDVHFGKTLYAGDVGQYNIIMECKSYEAQVHLLHAAIDIVTQMVSGSGVPPVQPMLDEASTIHRRTQYGPSTQAIVDAAIRRNIPVRRLSERSLIQLGHGIHRKWVAATITAQTSAVSVDVAADKHLTKSLLCDAGIPVPDGDVVSTLADALREFEMIGGPVAVKPYNGNQGRGVSLNVCTPLEVEEAFQRASVYADEVIVERHIEGRNLRILVVDGTFVAASERLPARVVGDGKSTIERLLAIENERPTRGVGHEKPLTRIVIDDIAQNVLRRQGFVVTDVPAPGQVILLRDSANLSTGGEAIDITDILHIDYRRAAERAARCMGLDVCGIDMITQSIDTTSGGYYVIEVNAAPGIRMHQHPSYGAARDAGDSIVASLFPAGETGRIPIVSVTGTNGKTTTTRLIGHGLASTGKTVGTTTTGGVYINGHQITSGDTTGPGSARMVLSDPTVEVAVLETARGGIVRGGLAYDKANVAVLTNITLDHIGQDGAETIEDLVHVKSLVAECVADDGVVVLNADDEHLVQLSKRLKARVVFFSATDNNPVVTRHLACGGVAYFLSKGWIVEGRGHLSWEVAMVREIPLTVHGTARFQVENCMAAVAAMRAMGLTRHQISAALSTFNPTRDNVGRCNMYALPNGATVILDYGHNPNGFERIGEWIRQWPFRRKIGVVGVPGDRADHIVRRSADQMAPIFDAFVVKEDCDKRGRANGEVAGILAKQIVDRCPEKLVTVIESEQEAFHYALSNVGPGELVVLFFEKLEPAQRLVHAFGGQPTAYPARPAEAMPAAVTL